MAETERYQQLMWVLDHTRGYPPGSFYQALLEAALKADETNLARIGIGFPDVAEAIRRYRTGPAEVGSPPDHGVFVLDLPAADARRAPLDGDDLNVAAHPALVQEYTTLVSMARISLRLGAMLTMPALTEIALRDLTRAEAVLKTMQAMELATMQRAQDRARQRLGQQRQDRGWP